MIGILKGFGENSRANYIERHIKQREEIVREYCTKGASEFVDNFLMGREYFWKWLVLQEVMKYYVHGDFGYFEKSADFENYAREPEKVVIFKDEMEILAFVEKIRKCGYESHMKYLNEMNEKMHFLIEENERLKKLSSDAESKARERAASIIEEAVTEAEKILEKAREEENIIYNSVKERIAEEQKKNNDAAIESTKKYLVAKQKQMKDECNEMMEDYYETCKENSGVADKLHTQMCDRTSELQAAWVSKLDETFEALTSLKFDFYNHLREWQISVCHREYRPIAQRYIELYRIVNINKPIAEAIMVAEKCGEDAENVIAALVSLEKKLYTFLKKFEQALGGFGLYVYYPAAGEDFNEVRHSCDDETVTEAVIAECVLPGVAYKKSDDEDGDIILPAYVKVICEEGENNGII